MTRVLFRCPECGQLLRAGSEHAGRQVRCAGCRAAVTIPVAHEPTVRPAEGEDGTHSTAGGWRWPRAGVGLLVLAIGLSIASTAGGLVFGAVPAFVPLLKLLQVCSPVRTAVELVGFTLCLFAPAHARVRRFAAVVLACQLATGALTALANLPVPPPPSLAPGWETGGVKAEALQTYIEAQRTYAARIQRRSMLVEGLGLIVAGVTTAVLPAFVRRMGRAVGVPVERLCDRLLQLGVAVIGFGVVMRVIVMVFVPVAADSPSTPQVTGFISTLQVTGFLTALLQLVWWAVYAVVLVRLWWGMRRRTRRGSSTDPSDPDRTVTRPSVR